MECVKPIIEIIKWGWSALSQQLSYILDLEKNWNTLEGRRSELSATRDDVNTLIQDANQQGKPIRQEATNWLAPVDDHLRKELAALDTDYQADRKFLYGCLPNYISDRDLGKRISEMNERIVNVKNEGRHFVDWGVVLVDRPRDEASCSLPTTPLHGKEAKEAFDLISQRLMDSQTKIIGIHGMGGVGKTTVMENIINSCLERKIFESAIMVPISQDVVEWKLQAQKHINKQLRLGIRDAGEVDISRELYTALLRRKNILFVLDDLWSCISLKDVSIPEPDLQNRNKVVIISRSSDVCRRMGAKVFIPMKVLSSEDAWSLFIEIVGKSVLDDCNLKPVVENVVEECGGLPLAINVIGTALRNEKDEREWRHALSELEKSKLDFAEGIEKQVIDKLKYSYTRLRNDTLQSCFLYFSLFPKDSRISPEFIVQCWICEGLIDEGQNREEELVPGHSMLNELHRNSMLEFVKDTDGVIFYKMHDLMRDMAISITNQKPQFMNKVGKRLKTPPSAKEWTEDLERVSLSENDIEELSVEPKCPKLLTLFLKSDQILETICPSFYSGMHNLRVLNLHCAGIISLPESLSEMQNLQFLSLRFCLKLKNLPSLKKLKQLRILMIVGTAIEVLPDSLSELENLKELGFRYCENLKSIPSLAKLKKLRKLVLVLNNRMEVLPDTISELISLEWLDLSRTRAKKVPPLEKLRKLKYLSLARTNIEELPQGIENLFSLETLDLESTRRLKSFPVGVLPKLSYLRELNMKGSSCVCSLNVVETPERRIRIEELAELPHLTKVYIEFVDWESFAWYFRSGKWTAFKSFSLKIRGSTKDHGMSLSFSNIDDDDGFQRVGLEIRMYHGNGGLSDLIQDLMDWKGPPLSHGTAFAARLAYIGVKDCPKLRNLLTLKLFQSLQCLQKITVSKCEMMEDLIVEEEDDYRNIFADDHEQAITLQNFEALQLIDLPKLKSICSQHLAFTNSSETAIFIESCPQLKNIPPCMDYKSERNWLGGHIERRKEWWDVLEWADPIYTKPLLETLFNEEVNDDDDDDDDDDGKRILTEFFCWVKEKI